MSPTVGACALEEIGAALAGAVRLLEFNREKRERIMAYCSEEFWERPCQWILEEERGCTYGAVVERDFGISDAISYLAVGDCYDTDGEKIPDLSMLGSNHGSARETRI